MKILNKTESAVFLSCRFSLFLKDSFFQIILRPTVIDIESFVPAINVVLSGPLGIEQNIAFKVAYILGPGVYSVPLSWKELTFQLFFQSHCLKTAVD